MTRVQLKNLIIGLSAFVALLALCNILTPLFYQMLPNDYKRTKLIVDAENTLFQEQKEYMVVFGNSAAMTGMNVNVIQEYLNDKYEVFNFAGVGQPINESALYYTKLPKNVKIVVQCFNIWHLPLAPQLSEAAAIAFSMYNYQLDSLTCSILPSQSYSLLTQSKFLTNYHARTAINSGLCSMIRNVIDDDAPSNEIFSLKYPYLYPSNKSTTFERNIILANQDPYYNILTYEIHPATIELIKKSNNYFSGRNIQYVLVIMPMSPDIKSLSELQIQSALSTVKQTFSDIPIIDNYYLLQSIDFYDVIHPNRIGGEKLSKETAQSLVQLLK